MTRIFYDINCMGLHSDMQMALKLHHGSELNPFSLAIAITANPPGGALF